MLLLLIHCANREQCYKWYANDRPFGICSKELHAKILLEIQDPNSPIYSLYQQDPNGYMLSIFAMCKEVERRKKVCDSRHPFF